MHTVVASFVMNLKEQILDADSGSGKNLQGSCDIYLLDPQTLKVM